MYFIFTHADTLPPVVVDISGILLKHTYLKCLYY